MYEINTLCKYPCFVSKEHTSFHHYDGAGFLSDVTAILMQRSSLYSISI